MATEICFICGRSDTGGMKLGAREAGWECVCRRCGNFAMTDEFEEDQTDIHGDDRLRLSAVIRRATDTHGKLRERLSNENYRELIQRTPIPDALEQADMFVEAISNRSRYAQRTSPEDTEAWAARLVLETEGGLLRLMLELETEGLIQRHTDVALPAGKGIQFSLTLKGWARAREIRRVRGPGNQAFVAMWFHPEMDRIFHEGFAPALRDTGYSPYRVDVAHHTNRIDDQIHAEIRRSKILIVDATGVRPSVYYEAGLARGLGLEVLWCCNQGYRAHGLEGLAPDMQTPPGVQGHDSWFSLSAFDTNHEVFTFWKDAADLRSNLATRIRGLGLDLPVLSTKT